MSGSRGNGGTEVRRREITICLRSTLVLPNLRTLVLPKKLRYFTLADLEIAIGILGIEDGWNEIWPVVAPFEQTGVSCQKRKGEVFAVVQTTPPFWHPSLLRRGNHQHTEHLAFCWMDALDFPLHFFGSEDA